MPDLETQRLLADLARADSALCVAKARLDAHRQARTIACACRAAHPIGELALIITHWYVEPHGCTGGDFWREGEWVFACPRTGARNALHFNDYDVAYEARGTIGVAAEPTFKALYRRLFASRVDEHLHTDPPAHRCVDVDNRRDDFELPLKKVRTP